MDASNVLRNLNTKYIGGQAQVSTAGEPKACFVVDHMEEGEDGDPPVLYASRSWRFDPKDKKWTPMVRTRIPITGLCERNEMIRGTCDGGFDCNFDMRVIFFQQDDPTAWEMPRGREYMSLMKAVRSGSFVTPVSTFDASTGIVRIPVAAINPGDLWHVDPVPSFSCCRVDPSGKLLPVSFGSFSITKIERMVEHTFRMTVRAQANGDATVLQFTGTGKTIKAAFNDALQYLYSIVRLRAS
ncbi:MAG: hypothetical protein WCT28_02890 [Patescibacteria group bacterium]